MGIEFDQIAAWAAGPWPPTVLALLLLGLVLLARTPAFARARDRLAAWIELPDDPLTDDPLTDDPLADDPPPETADRHRADRAQHTNPTGAGPASGGSELLGGGADPSRTGEPR